jgi:hypothetical protein
MGIRLDWQIESEQSRLHATEDPEARRRRQRARRQMILLLAGLAGVIVLVVGSVLWRLRSVDNQLRQDLIDTAEIEVTALRIGDFPNYMAIQRSASDAFLLEQSRKFDEYQQLKEAHRVELSGNVLSTAIDHQRGRVVLEETIDGVPYRVVWFYWRYEDGGPKDQGGWRHVPDDLTFWGEERTIDQGAVHITYHALDEDLARALAPRLDGWWSQGCQVLGCAAPPPALHVDIVAERPKSLDWSAPWTLHITSPLVGRARADLPLAPELEQDIARQVAARLVRYATGDTSPTLYSDAAWLHGELASWLAEDQFLGTPSSGFIDSLIAQYGPGAPGTVLAALRTTSSLDQVISTVSGVSMPLLTVDQISALDWRSFFQWRLDLEPQLLSRPDSSGAFLTLYDQDSMYAASESALRLEDPAYAALSVPQVTAVSISRDAESQTYAYADATRDDNGTLRAETIIWRLTGGTWKREN